ncbi:hypothetical protein CVT26_008648 [Gymnopilus dilepis]|uniref:Uncharacterized protein n=1 Tax=Gymnopilus dilepis TaxID=231916 RepID=A0A409XXY1_9AGAR|nr:hypothetical protein CVT26_008648 [Gymnopilus dilepis]
MLFDTLPVEIISIVFIFYVHHEKKRSHSPLILGRICRRWRQVAWSTPDLWTALAISTERATLPTHIQLAEEWLSRAGTLPLSISYTSDDCYDTAFGWVVPEVYKQMFEVLGRYSNRWRSLSLSLPSALLEVLGTLSRPSPMLHYLSVDAFWEDYDHFRIPNFPRIPTFSKSSPKVVDISCFKIALDWTAVTELRIELVDIAEVLFILQTASNLRECKLEQVSDHWSTPTEYDLIVCPILKDLSITFADRQSPVQFCDAISLPALTRLSYRSFDDWDLDFSMDDLLTFLTQSSCPLKKLIINEADFERGSLISVAPLLSSLTELHISFFPTSSDRSDYDELDVFYHILADPAQVRAHSLPFTSSPTQPLLPYLEAFHWSGNRPYPWETIPGLVQPLSHNRLPYTRPLRRVQIYCAETDIAHISYIPKQILQKLLEFEDVEYELTVSQHESQGKLDWWKASTDEWNENASRSGRVD